MKRFAAAFAAIAIAACSFASCSNNSSGSSDGNTETSAVSQSQAEEMSNFNEEDAKKTASEVINAYFDSLNNGDMPAAFKYQYEDNMLKAAAVISGFAAEGDNSDTAVEKLLSTYKENYEGHTLELQEIKSIRPITEKGYSLLDEMYGKLAEVNKSIEEKGENANLDVAEIRDQYANITDLSGYKNEYTDGFDAVCMISADGNESAEQEMFVYRMKGGTWKIDMAVVQYIQKVEADELDNTAGQTANEATLSIEAMAAEGKDISGRFIVGSDDSFNYNVPDTFDMKAFKKEFASRYSADPNARYFMVIDNKVAYYAVYETPEGKKGIYPFGLIIKPDGEKLTYEELDTEKTYTLDDLFDMSKKVISGE